MHIFEGSIKSFPLLDWNTNSVLSSNLRSILRAYFNTDFSDVPFEQYNIEKKMLYIHFILACIYVYNSININDEFFTNCKTKCIPDMYPSGVYFFIKD